MTTGISLHWVGWLVVVVYAIGCLGSVAQGHWKSAIDAFLIVTLFCWVGHLNFMLEQEDEPWQL